MPIAVVFIEVIWACVIKIFIVSSNSAFNRIMHILCRKGRLNTKTFT